MATIKTWKVLAKLCCCPLRGNAIIAAIRVLQTTIEELGQATVETGPSLVPCGIPDDRPRIRLIVRLSNPVQGVSVVGASHRLQNTRWIRHHLMAGVAQILRDLLLPLELEGELDGQKRRHRLENMDQARRSRLSPDAEAPR